MTSLQLILALATIYDYHIHKMDVITKFLHGVLHEETNILQSKGYTKPNHEHQVY